MSKSNARTYKGKSLLEFPSDFVVIDIETTGLDPVYDDIIEVSGIRFENQSQVDTFQSLINPGYEVGDFITQLTGITNDMLAEASPLEVVLPSFLSFIGKSLIVGHNVNFDINFLYDSAHNLGLPPVANDFVDTLRISRLINPDFPNHRLETLISRLEVGEKVKHRALSDCAQTAQCLFVMEKRAEENGGLPKPVSQSGAPLRAKDITPETDTFDKDSPIFGRTFVFTGTLEKMVRRDAMQAVVNAGGSCGDSITKKTNYLVLGNNDYCSSIKGGKSNKQKKAEKMQLAGADIVTISENVFYDMLEL